MDAVTDATPEEMKSFLIKADYTFAKMGSIKYKNENGVKFDITTLRLETGYKDSRHPSHVQFVKNPKIDVNRRDFTINGLYLNKNLDVIDYVNGVKDIDSKIIRMIGNPDVRLKEDPLRIIRAIRFAIDLDFEIDEELEKSIINNVKLLEKLNIDKIKQDLAKIKSNNIERKNYLLDKFGITKIL